MGDASSLGVTYRGEGNPEVAAAAIESAMEDAGMRCVRRRSATGAPAHVLSETGDVQEIEAVREGDPWYRVLAFGLPQRILWRVEGREGELRVSADFRLFPWFARTLWGLGVLMVVIVSGSFLIYRQVWAEEDPTLRLVLLAAWLFGLAIMAWLVVLVSALGGGRASADAWQPVLYRLEKAGGYLEPTGSGISWRYFRALLIAMAACFGSLSWVAIAGFFEVATWSPGNFAIMIFLSLLATILIGSAFLLLRGPVILRSGPVVLGLISSVALLFALLPPINLVLVEVDLDHTEAFTREATWVLGGFVPLGANEPAEIETLRRIYRRSLDQMQVSARSVIALLVLSVTLGMFITWTGLRIAPRAWVALMRLRLHRERGIYRQAVAGGVPLRRVRFIFFSFWGVYSVLVLTVLFLTVLVVLQAQWPGAGLEIPGITGDLPRLTSVFVAVSLSLPVGDPVLETLVRAVWGLYGLGLASLFALSVGQLWHARRRRRRALEGSAVDGDPRYRQLQETLRGLCETAGLGPVRLAVSRNKLVGAYSHVFGLFRRQRWVEVSEGALRRLTDEQLQALLAHELVHHRRGHVDTHRRARWLGRLTFVGDGFVVALLDSFGYEATADREAVVELGVPARNLLHCLWKIRNVNETIRKREALQKEEDGALHGLPFSLDGQDAEELARNLSGQMAKLSAGERWRLSWRLFLDQYFNAQEYHYWHPGSKDREAALRRLMEVRSHG